MPTLLKWVSVLLVGWSLARAIMALIKANLATQVRNRQAKLRIGLIEGTTQRIP